MTRSPTSTTSASRAGRSYVFAELLLRFRELGIVLALVLVVGATTSTTIAS